MHAKYVYRNYKEGTGKDAFSKICDKAVNTKLAMRWETG